MKDHELKFQIPAFFVKASSKKEAERKATSILNRSNPDIHFHLPIEKVS